MSNSNVTKHRPPKPQYAFRRNTLPPLLGLITFSLTLGVLNFQWLFAQVEYQLASRMHVPTISIDTSVSASARPAEAPVIWIPKINVHAPIIFESSANEHNIQKALQQGVVHYPMTGVPGESSGNVVIFGHSSGQPWAPGNYKFVFTLLNKLEKGDQIVIDFQGTRYVYIVNKSVVVDPYKTSVLRSTDTPTLSLITCSPVGTSAKRLVVTADQVSPKPKTQKGTQTTEEKYAPVPSQLPSNSLDFWDSVRTIF